MITQLISMFFPVTCKACGKSLVKSESIICIDCEFHLPKTGFHRDQNNPVAKNFWGKANLHAATAMYFFEKGEKVQKLLHKLKYKGEKEVGIKLGRFFAGELMQSQLFCDVDFIIPVPLHKNKIKKRGYNQSDLIAQGISEIWELPIKTDALVRKIATSTQTKKTRFERFENVDNIFVVNEKVTLSGKHVLLIDDVITTGSTLTSCANAFSEVENCKVSVGAIAFTHR